MAETWARRRERYGSAGMSEAARANIRAARAREAAARTHCKRGHEYTPENTLRNGPNGRMCRECKNLTRREQRAAGRLVAFPAGLIPYGMSVRQAAAQLSWATKRLRYGDSGVSPATAAKMAAATKARLKRDGHHEAKKTHCKRGHLLAGPNVRVYRRKKGGGLVRVCRLCHRRGRPMWVMENGVKVSITAHDLFYRKEWRRLRRRMLAAHPDKQIRQTHVLRRNEKTGNRLSESTRDVYARFRARRFIQSANRLKMFETRQAAWYAKFGLQPPKVGTDFTGRSDEGIMADRWATRKRLYGPTGARSGGWAERRAKYGPTGRRQTADGEGAGA